MPFSIIDTTPKWVAPPYLMEGSVDPLGFQPEADAIADALLPGVTVFTERARYLSFLCWAIEQTGNDRNLVDRWESALSVGEYLRHDGKNTTCKFRGIRLLKRLDERGKLSPGDHIPARITKQPTRVLYKSLMLSCGLVRTDGSLTSTGSELAACFNRQVGVSRLPLRVETCERMPCLSNTQSRETNLLRGIMVKNGHDAEIRKATWREVGQKGWQMVKKYGPEDLLNKYLRTPSPEDMGPAAHLRAAALLELEYLGPTRLFLLLYRQEGHLPRRGREPSRIVRPYRLESAGPELLAGTIVRLRLLSHLGGQQYPLRPGQLRTYLLERHIQSKGRSRWVDSVPGGKWKIRRHGLAPDRDPNIHSYRLNAFAGLLRDVGLIS